MYWILSGEKVLYKILIEVQPPLAVTIQKAQASCVPSLSLLHRPGAGARYYFSSRFLREKNNEAIAYSIHYLERDPREHTSFVSQFIILALSQKRDYYLIYYYFKNCYSRERNISVKSNVKRKGTLEAHECNAKRNPSK